MIRGETFYRDLQGTYWSQLPDVWTLNPVGETVRAARRLILNGQDVLLPDGYTIDTLDQVAALVGFVQRGIRLPPRQAGELAQIARELLARHRGRLVSDECLGITELLRVIGSDETGVAT